MRKLTTDEFIRRAREAHGEKYDYSLSVYEDARSKLLIVCPSHGQFLMAPDSHVNSKKGCPACGFERMATANKGTLENFLNRARAANGGLYDYSLVTEYQGDQTKVPVICREHGPFMVTPNNHGRGRGCPHCKIKGCGYRISKPGFLYILSGGPYIKIGITNRSPKDRAREVSNSSGIEFIDVHHLYFEDGRVPLQLETTLLKHMDEHFTKPLEVFQGSTESYVGVDVDALVKLVAQEVTSIKTYQERH